MTGMGSRLQTTNSTVVAAFQSALVHQGLVVLVVVALLALAWNALRAAQLRQAVASAARPVSLSSTAPVALEPTARRVLRLAFGCLWVFDAILQAQVSMPLGLAPSVLQPAASSSPEWVRHLVGYGVNLWNDHPVAVAAATVWIQLGVGLWLLVAPRGRLSRLGGIVSVGWGLVVWSLGEAFGSIFGHGLSWLFGAPGAAVFYVVAGGLVALPERVWANPRLGRSLVRGVGVFLLGMAVLQAWPGRGFWEGRLGARGSSGTLTAMVEGMAQTSQPGFLSSWLSAFGSFDAAHGFAVNLVVVVVLAGIGLAFALATPRLVRAALFAAIVLLLADWVLVEDLGFLGGVGTDPNSMVPMGVLLVASYLALVRPATVGAEPEPPSGGTTPEGGFRQRLVARPSYALRALATVGAFAIVVLGAAPMARAALNPVADPILSEALNGPPSAETGPAPGFQLIDQFGRTVSLRSLRGKVVALSFLDPVCTTDCPLIAQELRQADGLLGTDARRTEFVAIVANPLYRSTAVTRAFDRAEGLDQLSNWLYLTGSSSQLTGAWNSYGIEVATESAGAMVAHSDTAYVIDASGRLRWILSDDPGQGTTAQRSSFAAEISAEVRSVLAPS